MPRRAPPKQVPNKVLKQPTMLLGSPMVIVMILRIHDSGDFLGHSIRGSKILDDSGDLPVWS